MSRASFRLHPATSILLWLILAISIHWLRPLPMLGASMALAILLIIARGAEFGRLLRRTRLLLLSLVLIYAFASPGTPLLPAVGAASPTLQGLAAGALQAWRIALLIGALALLLESCPRNELLSGLYVLLRPFKVTGLEAERIAVRVWLTLHYAEQERPRNPGEWWHTLRTELATAPAGTETVTLEMPRASWRDALALAAALALAGVLAR